jgi:hypothetical protein
MVGIALASEKVVEPRRRVFSGSVCAGSDCPFRVGFSDSQSRRLQGPNTAHFSFIDRTVRYQGAELLSFASS